MTDARPTATTRDCDTDPRTRYVHILLAQMAKGNQREIELAQSEPLPDPFVPRPKELPKEITYGAVVGQLQAITHGYNPNVKYAPDSQCEIKINGQTYDLTVNVQEASCTVTLAARD